MNKITGQELAILGGTISKECVEDFLISLPQGLVWVISEYTDRCTFTKNDLPKSNYLERARLFGEGGDMEIRRDAEMYRWRFVGPQGVVIDNAYPAVDFWAEDNIPFLRAHDEKLYLWGRREATGNSYHQGKVASSQLRYPLETRLPYAIIIAKVFTYFGRPQFSWYLRLEGAE